MSNEQNQDEVEAVFSEMQQKRQLWNTPQFLVRDVCAITGATPKAIEHFLTPERNLVRLHGSWINPGTGKRRMFTGSQVLMIQSAYVANRIGFPQRFCAGLAETVERRTKGIWDGRTGLKIISWPLKDRDDWALQVIHDDMTECPDLPAAFHVLDVDRLISEVHSQLMAIVAGEEIPDYSIPDPVDPPNPYGPAANFFRSWEKDAAGRWVYVGLDHDETQELLRLQGSDLVGDELVIVSPGIRSTGSDDRYLELHDKHEHARQNRLGEEMKAKLREAEAKP